MGSRPAPRPARRGDRALRADERRAGVGLADRRATRRASTSRGSAAPRGACSRSRPPARSRARSRRRSGSSPSTAPTRCSRSAPSSCSPPPRSSRCSSGSGSPGPASRWPRAQPCSPWARSRPRPPAPCSRAPPPATGRRSTESARCTRRASSTPPRSALGGRGLTVREARDTRYHRLVVVEDEESRYLRFDSSFQSGMYLDDPFRTRFSYTDYLQLGLAYDPDAKRSSSSASAAASAQKRVWRDFRDVARDRRRARPGSRRDAAYRWFALPRDRRIAVDVDDGRRYLQRNDERFDVIMVDAYYSDGVPFHLTTLEFVGCSATGSRPGGVVARTSSARSPAAARGSPARSGRRTPRCSRRSSSTRSTRAASTDARPTSATSSSSRPNGPRRRRSSLARAWADGATGTSARAPDAGGPRSGTAGRRRRDRRRAAAHGRVRADGRAPARAEPPGRSGESETALCAAVGSDRRRHAAGARSTRTRPSSGTSTICVAAQRDHPAETAAGARGRPPATRTASPRTRSRALGVPPRWTWPRTVTRASKPVSSSSSPRRPQRPRRAARTRRRRAAPRPGVLGGGAMPSATTTTE